MLNITAFGIGAVLGGGTLYAMALGGVLRQRGTWAATIVAIAAFYVVFAIQSGDATDVVLHTVIAVGFQIASMIGARTSAWILASALLAHGIFDITVDLLQASPAPDWWGSFCFGIDLVLAFGLGVLLLRGRTLQ